MGRWMEDEDACGLDDDTRPGEFQQRQTKTTAFCVLGSRGKGETGRHRMARRNLTTNAGFLQPQTLAGFIQRGGSFTTGSSFFLLICTFRAMGKCKRGKRVHKSIHPSINPFHGFRCAGFPFLCAGCEICNGLGRGEGVNLAPG